MPNRRDMWSKFAGPLRVGWRLLASNGPRAIILTAGSVSIALAASSLAAAAVTSQTLVAQTVDAGWRGAYDLLVQPADATTFTIQGEQLVPLDFLAVRSSGITRAQWQAIQQIPGVEVAAPLATLGWMRPDDVILSAAFPTPDRGELVWITEDINGVDGTQIKAHAYFGIDYDYPGEWHSAVSAGALAGSSWGKPGEEAYADLRVSLPSTWGDIVGIDPVEEDRLVGLSGFVSGKYLQRGLTTTFDQVYEQSATRVPVITPSRVSLPGEVTMTMSVIHGVDVAALGAAIDEMRRTMHSLADEDAVVAGFTGSKATTVSASDTKAIADLIQPLRAALVELRDGTIQVGATGSANSAGRNVLLQPAELPYGFSADGRPTLESLGTWAELIQPEIAAAQPENFGRESTILDASLQYRQLKVTVPEHFMVDALGMYDLEAIASLYAGASNYVPLGIYGDPARQLVADAAGNPVDETLPISLNPGGLNPLPPIGLTNLETVEGLRGPQFIDAIRVRVADVTSYTPAAVDRIAQVATAIRERTGLHVDVVAGSSPVDVHVIVSRVGTVRERWTTLGEAPRIVSGAEGLSGLLLGGAGLVVLLYLGSFGVFLVDDQRRGLEILREVGWRRTSRTWLLVSQALLLGLASAVVSVVLLAVFDTTADVNLPSAAYPVAALAVIAAHMAAAGLAALTGRTRSARAVGRPGRWLSLGVVRLGLRNSLEAPRRLVIVAIALALAILIAGTIAAVEVAYGGELRATVLGGLVWLRVGWYHLLAAGAALFAAASIALDSGVLAVERRVGLIALLRATGWRARAIAAGVAVEVGLPAFAGGLMAVIPVVAVGAWVGLGWPVLVVLGAAAIGLGALVALMVAALPARLALAVDPARGLAAEGMTGALPGFALRGALATIVILALFVSGAGIGYGVLAPAAIPANAFVPVPSAGPPSATELALADHVHAVAAHPNRAPASTSLDWTFSYVSNFLDDHGGHTRQQEFVSNKATWLDVSGNEIDPGPIFTGGVAVSLGFTPESARPFTPATGDRPDCAPGVMLVRVSESDPVTTPVDVLSRCAAVAGTVAVLTVRPLSEEAWAVASSAASVRLSGGKILWATLGTPKDNTPLLVVPVRSTGPGAVESAAPIAVALELAATAQSANLPLRLLFADLNQPGLLPILARQVAETMPKAALIELGPLGGRLAAVVGVHWADPLDQASTRQGLLSSVVLDPSAMAWVERTANAAATDTSDALLGALAGETRPDEVGIEGVIAPAVLAIGIDAAYLGEPLATQSDTGTEADTADQVDISALGHALSQLTHALEVLDGQLRTAAPRSSSSRARRVSTAPGRPRCWLSIRLI
ncbi:MAG: FtsX-like permease family protein [Chloroflexota bacterium]